MMKGELARRPAFFLVFFFVLGIWAVYLVPIPLYFLWGGSAFFLLLSLWQGRKQKFWSSIAGLVLVMAALDYSVWREKNLNHPVKSFFPLESVSVSGTVHEIPKPGNKKFSAYIRQLKIDSLTININRKFIVTPLNPVSGLTPGDDIFLEKITLQNLSPPRNPGQFDSRKFLLKKGIIGEIKAEINSRFAGIPKNGIFHLKRRMYRIGEKFSSNIKSILPEKEANFLIGILLGKKEEINRDIIEDFQNTGLAHVLAISGLHVGYVVLFIYLLISFLPLPFRWQNILVLIFLMFYVLLTGSKPPVVRAGLMVSIYLIGRNLERKQDLYNTIYFAAFLILFFQPQQLFWTSFQFSFLAVLSILFFYEKLKPLENKIIQYVNHRKLAKILRLGLISPFLVSLSAQLGTLPLMVIYFNKIPINSFWLNIMVIPAVGLIVALGFLVLFFLILALPFTQLIANILAYFIELLIDLVSFSANFSFSYIQIPKMSLAVVIIYVLILFILVTIKSNEYRVLRMFSVVMILVFFFWIVTPKTHFPELLMLDVGQGDSSLMRTPDDLVLLFDSGPASENFDSGKNIILPAVLNWGHNKIDRIFISHPHADHIGGIFSLLKKIKIDSVYFPALQSSYFLQDSLQRELDKRDIGCRALQMGDFVSVGELTKIYILSPPKDFLKFMDSDLLEEEINNSSLITLVKIADQSLLFTGDAEKKAEELAIRWSSFLQAKILKVGHHGSDTSTSIEFLRRVKPAIALISVGRNNRHSHPSQQVLLRLKDFGVRYFRTDQQGAIWLKYIHEKWQVVNWK